MKKNKKKIMFKKINKLFKYKNIKIKFQFNHKFNLNLRKIFNKYIYVNNKIAIFKLKLEI